MEPRRVVTGGIVLAVGLVVLVIGLSPEMTCSVISAFGGQCIVVFGRLAVEDSFKFVPPVILGIGGLLALLGGALSVLGAIRKERGGEPLGPT